LGSLRAETDEATAQRLPPTKPLTWLVLAGIVVLGILLRGARLGEAPGGYLAFNEGFYIDEALKEAVRAPWDWFVHPLLYDKPPLYTGIVQMLYRFRLPEVAAARMVSVVAGTITIYLVFCLARLIYDERTALASAAAIAVMPGVVLVDHNIQVDPLFVALMMAALVLYVVAWRTERVAVAVVAGCVLGVAVLTKQPAVLALPAIALWEVWRTGSLRELRSRRFIAFVCPALLVGASWYVLELLIAPTQFLSAMASTGDRTPLSDLSASFWSFCIGSELLWMLFPAAAILALLGIAYMLFRRTAGDKFVLVFSAIFLAYYVPFHLHSYYLLPAVPFLALAIGRFIAGGFSERFRIPIARSVLLAILVAAMVLGSVLMLGGKKWGRWSPMSYDRRPDAGYSRVHVYYDSSIAGVYGPTLGLMPAKLSPTSTTVGAFIASPQAPGVENLLVSTMYVSPAGQVPRHQSIPETWFRPVLFGWAVGEMFPEDSRARHLVMAQVFTNGPWTVQRVGPWWSFGIHASSIDSGLYLFDRASFSEPQSQ
jgi:hypothetical protein